LFFGSVLESVAADLGIPWESLKRTYDDWWRTFAVTADWQSRLIKDFDRLGYVQCLTGRRRRAPLRRNQILNSPIQGTTCDVVMDGMDRLSEMADNLGKEYLQPIMQIHDDLPFILPEKEVDWYAETIIGE